MFQTVIFDLDGTILNTLEDLTTAGNYVCAQNGWPLHTQDEFRHIVGNGLNSLVKQVAPASAHSPLLVATAVHTFCTYYEAHNMDQTKPYDGILEMLTTLKDAGIQLAVYSNKTHQFTQALVAHYFPGIFQVVQGKKPSVPVKPDTMGTFEVMEALACDPGTTLFIGDSPVDVATADNAGLTAGVVSWGFRSVEELTAAGPAHVFSCPEAILSLVLGNQT